MHAALGGNLGGSTSGILSSSDAAVSFARDTGLDVIFPVWKNKGSGQTFSTHRQITKGQPNHTATGSCFTQVRSFLRCKGEGFEFIYPSKWLLDQTIVRRRMESMQARTASPSQPDSSAVHQPAPRAGL